jgi:hypothetical protein
VIRNYCDPNCQLCAALARDHSHLAGEKSGLSLILRERQDVILVKLFVLTTDFRSNRGEIGMSSGREPIEELVCQGVDAGIICSARN